MQHRVKQLLNWQLWGTGLPTMGLILPTFSFFGFFGISLDQSTLVNFISGVILLGAVYGLGWGLFSQPVGLWATGFYLLMPGLYQVRLGDWMDYSLPAMVTLCFLCITLWRETENQLAKGDRSSLKQSAPLPWFYPWFLMAVTGTVLGLGLLVKQPVFLFLSVPLVWVVAETLWKRAWRGLLQLVLAACLAVVVSGVWYRFNWLLSIMAAKRAMVDVAIAAPHLLWLLLDHWMFYLRGLPGMVSLPLLLFSLIGFLFFWRRSRVSSLWAGECNYSPKPKDYCQQLYRLSQRSLVWLLVFWIGGYLLSALNINQDLRDLVSCLPPLAVVLAYGFTLVPKRWQLWKWGTIVLAGVLLLTNLIRVVPVKI